jgi:hypothetical protein
MAKGERDELKLSNGFASGGDIKLDTDGKRFMLKLMFDSCREGNAVIPLEDIDVVDRVVRMQVRMDASEEDGDGGGRSIVGGRGR